jgi:hypothetical protein
MPSIYLWNNNAVPPLSEATRLTMVGDFRAEDGPGISMSVTVTSNALAPTDAKAERFQNMANWMVHTGCPLHLISAKLAVAGQEKATSRPFGPGSISTEYTSVPSVDWQTRKMLPGPTPPGVTSSR